MSTSVTQLAHSAQRMPNTKIEHERLDQSSAHDGGASWTFHAYSIWLFTRSDLKTIILPHSTFGILNALALSSDSHTSQTPWLQILTRLPHVVFWLWLNLLIFDIDNQRQSSSILEDKSNKSWRVMPSGRMTQPQAKTLLKGLVPTMLLLAATWLGGLQQSLCVMLNTYLYNDLNLSDWSWASRNAICAIAYTCFAWGALEVALGRPLLSAAASERSMLVWLAILAVVTFSTIQSQDLPDQDGDRLRERRTMPLTLGDVPTRWLTAVPVLASSVACPIYCGVSIGPGLLILGLGVGMLYRTLACRGIGADKHTWRLYNVWLACMYGLPFAAAKP